MVQKAIFVLFVFLSSNRMILVNSMQRILCSFFFSFRLKRNLQPKIAFVNDLSNAVIAPGIIADKTYKKFISILQLKNIIVYCSRTLADSRPNWNCYAFCWYCSLDSVPSPFIPSFTLATRTITNRPSHWKISTKMQVLQMEISTEMRLSQMETNAPKLECKGSAINSHSFISRTDHFQFLFPLCLFAGICSASTMERP